MEPTEESRARALALARLAVREHSERELASYLRAKGVAPEAVAATIARLLERKVLDDRRYARAVTRSQAVRGKGPRYILQKLRQKGVRIELAEVLGLFAESSDRDELELARALVERRYPRTAHDEKERRRAHAALLRRGFSGEVASRVTRIEGADEAGVL